MGLNDLHPSAKTSLQVPEIMEQLSVMTGKTEPGSIIQTNKEWYNEELLDNPSACVALAKDMAFFIKRQDAERLDQFQLDNLHDQLRGHKYWLHANCTSSRP